jgi:hypothetical protein
VKQKKIFASFLMRKIMKGIKIAFHNNAPENSGKKKKNSSLT